MSMREKMDEVKKHKKDNAKTEIGLLSCFASLAALKIALASSLRPSSLTWPSEWQHPLMGKFFYV